MKQESHRLLGHYLLDHLQNLPKRRHVRAFLIGCVEPDRNPFTYLKGSVRSRMFYGHNYQNADRWIERNINRLRDRRHWNLRDYYRMGQLIHYTSDAFTYVHNNVFTDSIAAHRAYENVLQEQFFRAMDESPYCRELFSDDLNDCFRANHERYLQHVADVHRDCRYILEMTSKLFNQLLPEAGPAPAPVPAVMPAPAAA